MFYTSILLKTMETMSIYNNTWMYTTELADFADKNQVHSK